MPFGKKFSFSNNNNNNNNNSNKNAINVEEANEEEDEAELGELQSQVCEDNFRSVIPFFRLEPNYQRYINKTSFISKYMQILLNYIFKASFLSVFAPF